MVKKISVPSPLLDAIIFLRFTFCGFCKTAYQLKARKKSGEKTLKKGQHVAPTCLIKIDSSSSSDEGHSSAALFETLRRKEESFELGNQM